MAVRITVQDTTPEIVALVNDAPVTSKDALEPILGALEIFP